MCCNNHLNEIGFLEEDIIEQLRYTNRPYIIIRGSELQRFMQGARLEMIYNSFNKFNIETHLTDDEFKTISGTFKEQYLDLFTFREPVIIPGGRRYITKKDLVCFLCKLRQGVSDEFLCIMFNYTSRQATSLAISNV